MITEQQAMTALDTLADAGITRPWTHAGPEGRARAAHHFAEALNHAGVLSGDLDRAVAAYIAEPGPKGWPTVGHLIARL